MAEKESATNECIHMCVNECIFKFMRRMETPEKFFMTHTQNNNLKEKQQRQQSISYRGRTTTTIHYQLFVSIRKPCAKFTHIQYTFDNFMVLCVRICPIIRLLAILGWQCVVVCVCLCVVYFHFFRSFVPSKLSHLYWASALF